MASTCLPSLTGASVAAEEDDDYLRHQEEKNEITLEATNSGSDFWII